MNYENFTLRRISFHISAYEAFLHVSRDDFGFCMSLEQLEPGEKGVVVWSFLQCQALVASEKSWIAKFLWQ